MKQRRVAYGLYLATVLLLQVFVGNRYTLCLLIMSVLLPALSLLLAFLTGRSVTAEFKAPKELSFRESGVLEVIFRNQSRLPVANVSAFVTVGNPLTGSHFRTQVRTGVSGKGQSVCKVALTQAELGTLYFAMEQPSVGDLFGLLSFSMPGAAEKSLTVEVPERILNTDQMPSMETDGESETYSELLPGNDPSELFDITEYFPGDDIRAIHWKLTAKSGTPLVRRFGNPLSYSCILLPELAGESAAQIEKTGASVVHLSRALRLLGIMHTLAWYDAGTEQFLQWNIAGEEQGETAAERLLRSAKNEGGNLSLHHFLNTESLPSDLHLFYFSYELTDPAVAEAAARFTMHLSEPLS